MIKINSSYNPQNHHLSSTPTSRYSLMNSVYVVLTFSGGYGRQEVVVRCFTVHVCLLLGGRAADVRPGRAHYPVPAECAEIPAARDGRQVLHLQHQLQPKVDVLIKQVSHQNMNQKSCSLRAFSFLNTVQTAIVIHARAK